MLNRNKRGLAMLKEESRGNCNAKGGERGRVGVISCAAFNVNQHGGMAPVSNGEKLQQMLISNFPRILISGKCTSAARCCSEENI